MILLDQPPDYIGKLYESGLDHRKLTYYYGGRDQRLTNFGGDPILKVFA